MASVCPECGSSKYQKYGYVIVNRERRQRYLCKNCLRSFTYPKYTGDPARKHARKEDDSES